MLGIKQSKIAKNASWLIGVKIIQSLLSFFVGMFTARYLGPSNYGLISYAASTVAFVIPVMNLGLTNVLVQELVIDPDNEGTTLGTSLIMCFTSSIICILGVFVYSMLANAGEIETIIVCSVYSLLLIFQALEITTYWFQAHLLSKYSSIVSFFAYVIVTCYKVFLLITQKKVIWFAVSNSIDYFIIAIALLIIYKKLNGQKLKFSLDKAKLLIKKSKYYIIANLMVIIFAETDKVMLKQMIGMEYTGFYTAAVTCTTITSFVFSAIIDSFRPDIFEKLKIGKSEFENRVIQLYSVIIYFSLIQCVAITVLSPLIIKIIYGDDYIPSISALRICVWYTTFSYIGSVRNIWILAKNMQKYLLPINMAGALANIVLNYFLIPQLGIEGAAVASLTTQFFTNVIVGYIIKPIRPNNSLMVKALNPKVLIRLLMKK